MTENNTIDNYLDESMFKIIKPRPTKLVMIYSCNNCQFCTEPIGPSYCHSIIHQYGFISCENCKHKGVNALADWFNTVAYGRVKHLKNTIIKIKRSSINSVTNSYIEDGWSICCPIVYIEDDIEYIECCNKNTGLYKNCMIDIILELN